MRPDAAQQAQMDWLLASPLSRPSKIERRMPQWGPSSPVAAQLRGAEGGAKGVARLSATMPGTLPSLSVSRSPKSESHGNLLSQSLGGTALLRQASEPQLRRPAARTAMSSRNAALGDPRVERALPRLQAKARMSTTAVIASIREVEAAAAAREPLRPQQRTPSASALGLSGSGFAPRRALSGGAGGGASPQKGSTGVPLEAWSEEMHALREISAVASSVARELDGVLRRCDALGDHSAADVQALREICSVTSKVREELLGRDEEKFGLPATPLAAPEKAYDDPILAKARRITALTNKLCDDLNSTSRTFGEATRDSVEVEALREISAVTRQVCESMRVLQGESWAGGVLRGPHSEGLVEEDEQQDGDPEAAQATSHEEPHRPHASKRSPTPVVPVPRGMAANLNKVEGLPDLEELLEQNEAGDGLSEKDVARMQTAFKRFKIPDSSDLHVGDVCALLRYLGHVMTQEEGVLPLVKDVTAYDYLDFDEFQGFMARYIPYERQQVHLVFQKFDEDQSGGISISELRTLLKELGYIPLHAMVQEALRVVDKNGSGDLDFDEFVVFLAVYRRAEGFTQKEVEELRRIFDFFSRTSEAPNQLLPAETLSNALVQFFGLHVSTFTEKLEEQLKSGTGLQSSSYAVGGSAKPESLRFSEFLIFARKTREEAMKRLRGTFPGHSAPVDEHLSPEDKDEFTRHDLDGNGRISQSELRKALKGLGYTTLTQNLEEMLAEVDKDRNGELDFSEFFDFMLIFGQREGFGKASVEEMRKVFDRFDANNSGEISALELAGLFRELGYTNTLDEIHIFVAQVDENDSGQLDFREFLRLMRLYREEELGRISEVFKEFELKDVLPADSVAKALEDLEPEAPKELVACFTAGPRPLDFDRFVGLVDACRAERVLRERKKAGFPDERIAELRALFDRFDKDKGGEIDTVELLGILQEFGWEPKTREEQQALMKKLETARQMAREAGIAEDAGAEGPGVIKFWTFVQLARMLETEFQHAEEERMQLLMQRLRFTQKEVEQFREIYLAKKQEVSDEQQPAADGAWKPPPKGLPRDAIRRLIKALGVAIVGDKKPRLDEELTKLGCPEEGLLDFFGFLQLMRWLMETGWLK